MVYAMEDISKNDLLELARLVRYWILLSTSEAKSGHPSSSLSAVELMVALLFGGRFRAELNEPQHPRNDRLIFSKGHASPLLYALYAAAGELREEQLMSLRKFGSPLEGHPTPRFRFAEAATGSLGQGLSIGLGMALNAKYLDKLPYNTYVLLGDGELAEGQNWEAIQLASHYKLGNLIAILDVNRLGQASQTMLGHEVNAYAERISAFGWRTITVNGHDFPQIIAAYRQASYDIGAPTMIIAKTLKGKGIARMEDKEGWHGKPLSKREFTKAVKELGKPETIVQGTIAKPAIHVQPPKDESPLRKTKNLPVFKKGMDAATRVAYGSGLVKTAVENPLIVVLDADMKNSTYAKTFEEHFPERFFEMYIAEQNMVSVALGLSLRGKVPFVSTFGAFLTRAFDQIRMASYSHANIKFAGSHVGVSIGQDGPSQMGLEDIAMFRSIHSSVVLYPSDAVSCEKLVAQAASHHGIVYLRTTRKETPVIYDEGEEFRIGGSKVVEQSESDRITVIGAGVTLHEALDAHDTLKNEGISIRVIDLYSVKPIDVPSLKKAATETEALVVVEDHHPEGGIAEAIRSALSGMATPIHSLSVTREEMSGKPEELLDYEDIASIDIVDFIHKLSKET